ncbi:MAG TPA: hypothetical protein VM554_10580 [Acidisarcina sp.]|nr:hypothetical protein [Acidisarcina sp.]
MLKFIEAGLLAVSVLVCIGLIVTVPARRKTRKETEAARIANDAPETGRS